MLQFHQINSKLKEHTHYLVLAGSHSYGTATSISDIDIRGWIIPPKEFFFSHYKKFEQTQQDWTKESFPWYNELVLYERAIFPLNWNLPIDSCIYNLQKFIKLAAACNPNIIELLFTNEDEIIYCDELGEILRNNRNLFLTARAHFTFTGYAVAQLKRINTHRKWLLNPPTKQPIRKEYGLLDRTVIPADQRTAAENLIEKQVRLWLLEEAEIDATLVQTIQNDLTEAVSSVLAGKDFRESIRQAAAERLGMTENFIDILQRERQYHQKRNEWSQYQNWLKTRNPVRAQLEMKYGYDVKHATHLIRLLIQAHDILEQGTLILKDKERADYLQEIKAGKWSYDELMNIVNTDLLLLETRYNNSEYVVPKKPNVDQIDQLMIQLIEKAYAKKFKK